MRLHAARQKVRTPFGSVYAEVEYDQWGNVTRVSIAHPQKHTDTAVGDALEAIADAINDVITDIRLSRGAAGRTAQVAVPPKPAANADLHKLAPVAPPRAPGRSFQGEQHFDGSGE
tara:strand:+ start:959 stop:1306 length:348 start_codon:yes stop_codon:yes gene_type:complete